MPKVTIKSYNKKTDYEPQEITIVEIDGIEVGRGTYGGEPEDAYRCRDYGWVEILIEKVAEKLGAKVELDVKTLTPDEWEQADY